MTTDREVTRIVRSWLEEGPTVLPDRVLDQVLDGVPAISQRGSRWPPRWWDETNAAIRLAIAAAAVVVVAVLGISLFPGQGGIGGPGATATPTASPTVVPRQFPPINGELSGGAYTLGPPFPVPITFDVPSGWSDCSLGIYEQQVCLDEVGVSFMIIDNVVADPCDPILQAPAVGRSVDDLVAAISSLDGFTATAPVDVEVDGFPGKQLTVTAPADPGCELLAWASPERTNGVGHGEVNDVRIVDIDGTRVLVAGAYFPGRSEPEVVSAMQQILDSIRIGG